MTDEIEPEVTPEVTAEETTPRRRRKASVSEVTEVVGAAVESEPEVFVSAQTLAEMAHGAEVLKKHLANSAAE